MKVYVVTSGCYSDYSIDKIFLNKDKAEEYILMANDSDDYDSYNLEIYETSDNKEYKTDTYLRIEYDEDCNGVSEYDFAILKQLKAINDNESDSINYTYYNNYGNDYRDITIHRLIPNENFNKEFLENKYRKVCQDFIAQFKYFESQGWTKEDINKWFEKQVID